MPLSIIVIISAFDRKRSLPYGHCRPTCHRAARHLLEYAGVISAITEGDPNVASWFPHRVRELIVAAVLLFFGIFERLQDARNEDVKEPVLIMASVLKTSIIQEDTAIHAIKSWQRVQ